MKPQTDPTAGSRTDFGGKTYPPEPLRPKSAGTVIAFLMAIGLGAFHASCPGAPADAGKEAAAATEHDRALIMERYVVSATRVAKAPWRYASMPGIEVLSRGRDKETNAMITSIERGLWLQNDVMPKDWLPANPVAYTIIIDNSDLSEVPAGQPHTEPIKLAAPPDAATWGPFAGQALVWNDQFEAHDGDTLAFNSNIFGVNMKDVSYGSVSLDRLSRSTPPLPIWLIAGLIGRETGMFREGFVLFSSEGIFGPGWIRLAKGPGTLWVSLDETARLTAQLKDDSESRKATPIEMVPLRELFREAPTPAGNLPRWNSEAALFARWGLMGPGSEDPTTAHAFLEFVRRARRQPVTEQMFTECFGFGFAVMETKLQSYLRTVLGQPTSVDLDIPSRFPKLVMRAATSDQIGRILGDWLRMQGDSFRNKDPDMSREFLFAAGRMLERAYKNEVAPPTETETSPENDRPETQSQAAAKVRTFTREPLADAAANQIHDPGLLAVCGLYEYDAGDNAKARAFLEAAAAAGAVRPRAYYMLARLRFLAAADRPMGSEGKLSSPQAASILEPLRTALKSAPAPDVFELLVGTWAKCEGKPAKSDIEEVEEGVALYPRDTDLAYNSAELCAQSGFGAEAARLIDEGLVFTSHEAKREHFEQLRSSLGAPAKSTGKVR